MLSTLLKKLHDHLVGQHDFPTLFEGASVYSIPDEEDRPVRVIEYTGDDMYRLYHFVESLRAQFAQVSVIDASDELFGGAENYLVMATDGTYPFTNVIPYD